MKYGLVRIVVAKIDINTNRVIEYVSDKMENKRDVYIEGDFTHGDYIIYLETEWYGDWGREMVVSAYSENSVHLTEIESTESFIVV